MIETNPRNGCCAHRLYHYTDMPGFLGIIEKRELWLSNVHFLSDFTEHLWLRRKILEVLEGDAKYKNHEHYHDLKSYVCNDRQISATFCTCFSEEEDSISQWDRFAGHGSGVALGFAEVGEHKLFSGVPSDLDTSIELKKVEYDENCQREKVETALTELLANAEDGVHWGASVGSSRYALWGLAAYCKHPDYRSENEWRLVLQRGNYVTDEHPISGRSQELRFRTRASQLVPYVVYPLFQERSRNLQLREIKLGPRCSARHAEVVIDCLLRKNAFEGVKVTRSRIPAS